MSSLLLLQAGSSDGTIGGSSSVLLLEDAFGLLLEDGTFLLLEA